MTIVLSYDYESNEIEIKFYMICIVHKSLKTLRCDEFSFANYCIWYTKRTIKTCIMYAIIFCVEYKDA